MVNMVPLIDRLFSLDPNYKTNQPLMDTMKNWSNHLAVSRKQIKEIRDGNVKAAQFVGMVFQDVPYAVPLHKFFKNTGMPTGVAMPLAWGMGYALGFDEEKVSMFLNSKDLRAIKDLVKIIPDTPEDKLFDNAWQMLEGTSFMALFPQVWKGIKFAKRNIPKLNTETIGQATALAGTTAVLATAATEAKSEENITHKDNIAGNILSNKTTHKDNITGNILSKKTTHKDNIIGNILSNKTTHSDNIGNNTISKPTINK